MYPLFCDAPHKYIQNLRAGIDNEAKAARKNAATERALRRALKANRCSGIVISGEALSNLSPAGVGRLKAALAPYAARFRVIAYVRDPYGYMTSAFQEHLREGADYDQLVAKPPLPHYRARLSRFIDVFGRDQVDIRIFDQAHFVGGDLITDFLSAIEADPSVAADLKVIRRNEGLSLEAAWLIKAANQLHPRSEKLRANPARAVKLPHVLAAASRPALQLAGGGLCRSRARRRERLAMAARRARTNSIQCDAAGRSLHAALGRGDDCPPRRSDQ